MEQITINKDFDIAKNKLYYDSLVLTQEELYNYKEPVYIKTGFKLFDEMTYGIGLGNLIKIQAPTGEGKTSFLTSLMLSVAKNNPHRKFVYIDYEMSKDYLKNAKICYTHGIKQNTLRFSFNSVKNIINLDLVNSLNNISYIEYDPFDKSFWKNVFVFCKEMHIDVIFFDYIGAVISSGDDAAWIKLKEEASIIAANAKSYDIGVVFAQQTNKDIKQIDKHNLPSTPFDESYSAGSSQVAQKCDVSMTLIQLDKLLDGSYDYRLDLHKGRQGQEKCCRYFTFNIDTFKLETLAKSFELLTKTNYESGVKKNNIKKGK